MKVAVVLGSRPEIIKMSPIVRELERRGVGYFILHTGQHYSYDMNKVFFEGLNLPQPKYNLKVGSGTHAEETGKMLIGVEGVLVEEEPDVVLVEGDTNTVLASALAAVKLGMPVGHVEAGLRSYDREMPEEVNRVLTDHMSDLLFAPTDGTRQNLLKEGIPDSKIFVTGNTIVDAVVQNLDSSKGQPSVLSDLNVNDSYFLVTAHRQENVDRKERFQGILEGLRLVHKEFGLPVIYPIHPRARKRMKEFNLNPEGLTIIDPVSYMGFLQLESKAKLILTDSGGIQEEACILKVPCVTLRYSTERPETVNIGANALVGTDPVEIVRGVKAMLNRKRDWVNPFGDGRAAARIVENLVGWKSG